MGIVTIPDRSDRMKNKANKKQACEERAGGCIWKTTGLAGLEAPMTGRVSGVP
ncbi:MAG: hypothetical protein V3V82_05495 [Acidimicrobiia bacterium]